MVVNENMTLSGYHEKKGLEWIETWYIGPWVDMIYTMS